MNMERTEALLIQAARDGHEDAFQQIVVTHSAAVFAHAYRMTGNEQDAEEVVQDTFLRAYRQLARFDGRATLRTWLYRIASNRAIDLLRARKRRDVVEPLEEQHSEPASKPGQDAALNNRAIRQKLLQALDQLSGDERTAFVLRHFEHSSIAHIAQALNIRPNAAKNTVFRAVSKLRKLLKPLRTL